ncbi:hypothetical protein LCGC14_1664180 [marine sediment metagenome]|uniref:Sensor of ECF-type sigma factor n=2 Tax=root TaxID=1 RepID=A0A831QTC4_9FLAO|nr:hypothetical protein [Pricia antarctica]
MNNFNILIVLCLLLSTSQIFAQHKPDKDKIKSLKVAFLTERLDLTSKEAQTFWPVYNEFEDKREAMREREHTEIREKMWNSESLSEKEASALINHYLRFEEEEEELDKNFIESIREVIPAKKTLMLLRSEYEFKRQLLKQYRNKKGDR